MSDQLNVRLSIKPHDMDPNLVRVVFVANTTIRPSGGSENVRHGVEQLQGIEHVIHVGKKSVEVYVLEADLVPACENMFRFIARGTGVALGDLQIIFGNDGFAFDDRWAWNMSRLRSGSSAQRPA